MIEQQEMVLGYLCRMVFKFFKTYPLKSQCQLVWWQVTTLFVFIFPLTFTLINTKV
jgi:hypothetical protein